MYSWHVKTKGTEFADAHFKRMQLRVSKFFKSPAGRAAQRRSDTKRRNKQAKAQTQEQS